MSERTYNAAIREAFREELRRDRRVVLMGEDIGKYGGAFKITAGLADEFGLDRVVDTPISENAVVGAAVGAAIGGLIPVVELQYAGFATIVADTLVTHAAFLRYMSGGQLTIPMVVRMPLCQYREAGAQHSFTGVVSWFSHVPGLKVVAPATPYDAKGLFKSAVRDSNPVVFFEHTELYRRWNAGVIPNEDYTIPIGQGEIKRQGNDVSLISYSLGVHKSLEAAVRLHKNGVEAEVVDLRTLAPLDKSLILDSVKKTGRVVIVDVDFKTGGIGGEIASIISEEALYQLKAPIRRVATADTPVPFSPALEKLMYPEAEDIVNVASQIME